MKCPKCQSAMETVKYNDVEVDRCSFCKGIWFDAGETEALRNVRAANAIDIGQSEQGDHMNPIDRYACPRCSGGMVRMVDPKQSHIWFEKCSSCSGSFFDAGEFRDLAEVTIRDFFRSIATPERL